MPAIGDFQYGYDKSGMESYLAQIQSEALTNAKEAVKNISGITNTCQNEWEGKARDNFITNLKKDADHVADQFQTLFEILRSEVNQAQAAMANKDETLIQT